MTPTDEWVQKAEQDYKAASDLNRRRMEPTPDVVCNLCQQSAEKYLKAYLADHGDSPPRIHHLDDLLTLCAAHEATLLTLLPQAKKLNLYAVDIRYPGLTATVADAADALTALRHLRRALRRELGL